MKRIKLPAKNMSFWVALVLSIAAGLSVLYALYMVYMPVKVLVPKSDISQGAVIGEADIGYISMSQKDKHPLAATDPGQVIGKYAAAKLYAGEPIIPGKLTDDPDKTGITGGLAEDETTITFKLNEIRLSQGVKAGDSVTAVVLFDDSVPSVIAENLKVVELTGAMTSGQIDQLKNVIASGGDNSITLAIKWKQLGGLLYGRAQSKELWILPELPGKTPGGEIVDREQFNRFRQERTVQASAGKTDKKP